MVSCFKLSSDEYVKHETQDRRHYLVKAKLANLVEGEPWTPFSIDATPSCRVGRYSILWIATLYPWSLPDNTEY